MNTCPLSGTPLKLIPAGTSKSTGKPYNAFYVCEIKGCKGFHNPVDTGLTQKPRYEAPVAPQSILNRNFEQEAYVKCCSIWAAADLHTTAAKNVIENLQHGYYWELFQAIKKDGEKRFSPVAQAALKANPNFFETVQPDAPEDLGTIRVEDIPFN